MKNGLKNSDDLFNKTTHVICIKDIDGFKEGFEYEMWYMDSSNSKVIFSHENGYISVCDFPECFVSMEEYRKMKIDKLIQNIK